MTRIAFRSTAALFLAGTVGAQQQPPIRPLGPVVAASAETFGANVFVRHASNGVLVNDIQGRRLVMLDPALGNVTVIADSTPATANAYSGRMGSLIAYRGDSSLFIDAQSLSMLVIDGAGKVARVMSVPQSRDASVIGNPMFGATFDPAGRIVYRPMPRPDMRQAMIGGGAGGGGGQPAVPQMPQAPDSAAILAVNLQTRKVDTLAWAKVPKIKMDIQRDDNGVRMQSIVNPLPIVDDWAVLSDGTLALVRGRDYHIDFIRPDGSRESAPKIPFDWRRLTDEDKAAFLDSVRAARERMQAQMIASGGAGGAVIMGGPGGEPVQRQTIVMGGGGGAGGPPGDRGRQGGPGGAAMSPMPIIMVPASDLPDYQPPFFSGSTRADADGRLWIRTIPTKNIPGGPIYDVISAKGELVDRVQVPQDRMIVGFGPGGVVYLAARDGTKTKIEKANYR